MRIGGTGAKVRASGKAAAVGVSLLLLVAAMGWPGAGEQATAAASPTGLGCQDSASTPIPQPTSAQLDAAGLGGIPLAPEAARRDLVAAPFSDPTAVVNPFFPIAELDSAILTGHVDGKVFHTETTLLPFTQIIEWTPGQCVRVLESQYMAFLDGRLQETAINLYAQVGDVNRPENIPGTVFEEVEVTQVDRTFDGPSGPVSGGIVGTETHQDGTLSDKLFAPGYGEFRSTDGPDVEAMALASPTDSLPGGVPADLVTISSGADRIFASRLATRGQWNQAESIAQGMLDAWTAFRDGDVPPRLVKPASVALGNLVAGIASRDRSGTHAASIDAAYASNDIQLRYRPVTEIDAVRFELWTRRAPLDATDGSLGGVRSDVVTLEWIRDRIAHTLDPVTLTRVDALVGNLGTAVVDEDLAAAAHTARDLRQVMSGLI